VQALRPAKSEVGFVSLVGAGPGDPALLTRKAIATLRASDLVLYDALVDDRILRYARHAQRFFVGKREGRHVLTQEKINALMIRAARRGRRVVRLKGGDPFVLGRGGEEAIALSAAGVPCDVVPGISSAIAAPALAGIPVTHRGLASSFFVVSGHDVEAFSSAITGLDSRGVTLVVLMGLARTAALASRLLDRGWMAEMPAAVIVDASSTGQRVWRGTLGELAAGAPDVVAGVAGAAAAPGTIVVGEVVSLAEALCQPSTIRPHTAARG
jgi:uroporphyrin-III C-methyltransferase/precorrin-2 dehydrogenase/sirohydrochlorin ferrochelatase